MARQCARTDVSAVVVSVQSRDSSCILSPSRGLVVLSRLAQRTGKPRRLRAATFSLCHGWCARRQSLALLNARHISRQVVAALGEHAQDHAFIERLGRLTEGLGHFCETRRLAVGAQAIESHCVRCSMLRSIAYHIGHRRGRRHRRSERGAMLVHRGATHLPTTNETSVTPQLD